MSDLRRAVEAGSEAFAPDRVPPFEVVVARKRARERRARTGGALAAVGLAACAVVLVPLSLGGGDDVLPTADRPTVPSQTGGDGTETYRYDLGFADQAAYDVHIEAASACLDAAEPTDRAHIGALGGAPVFSGTVIGSGRADALRECTAGLDGVQLTIEPGGEPPAEGAERSSVSLRRAPLGERDLLSLSELTRPEGVLRGDSASECLWLETDGGKPIPVLISVGEGIYVDFSVSPFQITDGRGYSVPEGTPVRLVGDYQPDETGIQGCPVPGAPFVGSFLVESEFGSEPVQDGFRNTGAGYTEKSGDGPSRMVGSFENIGAAARTATFVVDLKADDGTVVWTGRATVQDIDAGETVLARYESPEPLPDGSQYVVWRVEGVVR